MSTSNQTEQTEQTEQTDHDHDGHVHEILGMIFGAIGADPNQITGEQTEHLDADGALELAVAAAAGASNRIANGKPQALKEAKFCQRQSALWLDIHERMQINADREEYKVREAAVKQQRRRVQELEEELHKLRSEKAVRETECVTPNEDPENHEETLPVRETSTSQGYARSDF